MRDHLLIDQEIWEEAATSLILLLVKRFLGEGEWKNSITCVEKEESWVTSY